MSDPNLPLASRRMEAVREASGAFWDFLVGQDCVIDDEGELRKRLEPGSAKPYYCGFLDLAHLKPTISRASKGR